METSTERKRDDGGEKMPKRSKTEEPAAAAESQPTTNELEDGKPSSECKISTKQIPAAAAMPVQQTNSTNVSTCSCCCTTTKRSRKTNQCCRIGETHSSRWDESQNEFSAEEFDDSGIA